MDEREDRNSCKIGKTKNIIIKIIATTSIIKITTINKNPIKTPKKLPANAPPNTFFPKIFALSSAIFFCIYKTFFILNNKN